MAVSFQCMTKSTTVKNNNNKNNKNKKIKIKIAKKKLHNVKKNKETQILKKNLIIKSRNVTYAVKKNKPNNIHRSSDKEQKCNKSAENEMRGTGN